MTGFAGRGVTLRSSGPTPRSRHTNSTRWQARSTRPARHSATCSTRSVAWPARGSAGSGRVRHRGGSRRCSPTVASSPPTRSCFGIRSDPRVPFGAPRQQSCDIHHDHETCLFILTHDDALILIQHGVLHPVDDPTVAEDLDESVWRQRSVHATARLRISHSSTDRPDAVVAGFSPSRRSERGSRRPDCTWSVQSWCRLRRLRRRTKVRKCWHGRESGQRTARRRGRS